MLEFANIYVKVNEYKIDIQFIMKEGEENRSTEGPAFIKLVTLNDPPSVYANDSVSKCRIAEIKVTTATWDRRARTAAFAEKVNATTLVPSVNVGLIEEGMNDDQ